MAYGYTSYNADGTEAFSTADSTWTLLGVYTAPANQDATFTGVPVMPTRIVTRQMINQVTGDDEAYIHLYSLNGTTLTATVPTAAYVDGVRSNTPATFLMVFGK